MALNFFKEKKKYIIDFFIYLLVLAIVIVPSVLGIMTSRKRKINTNDPNNKI